MFDSQPAAPSIEAIETLAQGIVERRLETPALLFLEMHLPLTAMFHTGTLFLEPFLTPLFGAQRFGKFSAILSERSNVSLLIDRIRSLAETRGRH